MLILSWHITFTLESVQTDLESVHFCQIFNRFLFTSSSHFPSLTVKESFASKLQVYYLQLLPLWHPIFYKSIFERTAVLFLWSAPNVLRKWKLSANDFFFAIFCKAWSLTYCEEQTMLWIPANAANVMRNVVKVFSWYSHLTDSITDTDTDFLKKVLATITSQVLHILPIIICSSY